MMLWTLVVVVFVAAIAIATAVVARYQVRQLRQAQAGYEERLRKLNVDLETQLERRRKSELAASDLTARVLKLEMGREDPGGPAASDASEAVSRAPAEIDEKMAERVRQATTALAGMRRWADAHFTAASTDAAQSERMQELERYVVSSLDHDAASASAGPRILICGLHAEQPSVLDILPGLLEELDNAVDAKLMYRLTDGPHVTRFYVRWPSGPAPSIRLRSMLKLAVTPGSTLAAETGAAQLQAVLRALSDGGPSVLQLGPMLIVRTKTGMSAGFVPADRLPISADQIDAAIAGTAPDLLTSLGADYIENLNGWCESAAA